MSTEYFNSKLKDKAYLVEFYSGQILEQTFSFCLPATNEQISSPQKIYETKTYGGSVIDDYGNDIEQINLSGSTVNTEVRQIYTGRGITKSVTGEQEIFRLRDLLRTYGRSDKLVNKHVYLYDLASPEYKGWEVFPKELRIERTKETPFAYTYSFSLLGREGAKYTKGVTSWRENLVSKFNDFKETMESYREVLLVGMTYFDEALETIDTIENLMEQTEGIIQSYMDVVNQYLDAAASVMNESVGLGDYVIKSPLRIFSANVSLFNSTKDLLSSCNSLKDWCRNLSEDTLNSVDAIKDQYNASMDEIKDEWNLLTNQMCSKAEAVHASSIMTSTNSGYIGVPGSGDDDDTIRLTYGIKERQLKDGDTWDGIAYEVYGDAGLGTLLASYNGTLTEESGGGLETGKTIYIPVLEESESMLDNEVYNAPGVVDNYGKDIAIEDGDYTVQNGDLAAVSGVDNLTQALLSRLSTSINSRIRDTVYGIRGSVGYSIAIANKYLAASIIQTVMTDPRVSEVQELTWEGDGSELKVTFSYTDINDQNQNYGGA